MSTSLYVRVTGIITPIAANGVHYWVSPGQYSRADSASGSIDFAENLWRLRYGYDVIFTGDNGDIDILPTHWTAVEGFEGNPVLTTISGFEISTADDLQAINTSIYTLERDYIQVNDIDLALIANFNPIGNANPFAPGVFAGSYEGQNFSISNVTISSTTLPRAGLFGVVASGSRIHNVAVENMSIAVKTGFAGGFVGIAYGFLQNCHVVGGSVVTLASPVANTCLGGFASINQGTILSCDTTDVDVTNGSTGTACATAGFVAVDQAGGMEQKCSSVGGTVTGETAGGFAGVTYNSGATTVLIEDCYSRNNVSGSSVAGGFVGSMLSGVKDTVQRCYSAGTIGGAGTKGAMVGVLSVGANFVDNYYDATLANGVADAGHGTGLTTAAMKKATSFVGWNFRTLWDMDVTGTIHSGYPYLNARRAASSYPGLYQSLYRKR